MSNRGGVGGLAGRGPRRYIGNDLQPERTRQHMRAILDVVLLALDLYVYVIIAAAIFSWLYAFNVVNPRNPVVAMIGNALYQITEPVLRPIRNLLPTMGGLDLSPIVLLLGVFLIQRVIIYYLYPLAF
jgi:YggT family protein